VFSRGITTKAFEAGWYFGFLVFLTQHFIGAQHAALGTVGPDNFGAESLGADIFGALSFGGLIDGALTLGLQQPALQHDKPPQQAAQVPHFMHDLIPAQHPTLGTVGPDNFGADIFGALSFGGLIDGALIFGLQQPALQHDKPPQQAAQVPHFMHDLMPPQHPTLGTVGPDSFGADIFGALSFGGLMDGAFNFGLQHVEQAPQPPHESLQFYQHPTFLAILGPSSLGPDSFGADILGALSFGAGASAAANLLAPFGSFLVAAGINIA
jgi:ABC-type dipeptide/oligopeptide/nickel transport system permease subunit